MPHFLEVDGQRRSSFTRQGFNTVAVRRDLDAGQVDAVVDRVSPAFFETASIQMRRGRDFSWNDVRNEVALAILNQSLADRLFPGGDAVGRTIRLGQGERILTVIGIVEDATPGDPRIQQAPQVYLPLGPAAPPAPALLLRLKSGTVTEASLRALIEPLGRHTVLHVGTMHDQVERFLAQERLITFTSLFFAALATIVAIAGLHATLAENIARRTREIGIRIAVGATPAMVRRLVLSEAGRTLGIGVCLGVPAAVSAGQASQALLSGTPLNSQLLLVITVFAICGAAVLAAAWLAQRAATTPVATALRSD